MDTKVTDAGLKQLKGLTRLKTLSLARTQITDAGLAHLQLLRNLKVLDIADTQVSEEGVIRLGQLLPGCAIHY